MAVSRIPPEIFFLDRNSTRSLQAQIRETVVSSVLSHQALPGALMPSSRRLADHLGVARMTITLAFQELVAQGYLQTQARQGYLVAADNAATRVKVAEQDDASSASVNWDGFLSSSLVTRRRLEKPVDWRNYLYPFAYGQMDSNLFNLAAWRECSRQAIGKRDFDDLAGDLAASDDPILVNYIRARTLPRRGISAEPDEILVTVGAQNALWLIIELLTRKPLKAVCENPGYPDTRQALRWCGADVTTLDIDADGLPPEDIPAGTRAVFVTPSHHAPTGATMPTQRRQRLLEKASQDDFVVVEDDYEFEMSFLEPPSAALKSFDHNNRVLYVGSFSKALFPGLRLGYLVGSKEFIAEARELRSMILRHPPGHLQRTTAYFLAQGHYDVLVRNMRRKFASRHAVMQASLEQAENLKIIGAARFGGSSFWLSGPDDVDAEILAETLLEDGVLIEPGGTFFNTSDGNRNFFRLGFSSISADRIAQGIKLIDKRSAQLKKC